MNPKIIIRFGLGTDVENFDKSGFVTGDETISEMCFLSMNRRTYINKTRENKLPPRYTMGVVLEKGVGNYENAITTSISKEKFEAIIKDIGTSLMVTTTYFSRYGEPSVISGKIVTYHMNGVDATHGYAELYFEDEAAAEEFRQKRDSKFFGPEICDNSWAPEVVWTTTPHYENKAKETDEPGCSGASPDTFAQSLGEAIDDVVKQFGGSVRVIKLGEEGFSSIDARCVKARTCESAHACPYGQWAFDTAFTQRMLSEKCRLPDDGKDDPADNNEKKDEPKSGCSCHGKTTGDKHVNHGSYPGGTLAQAVHRVADAVTDLQQSQHKDSRAITNWLEVIAHRKTKLSKKTIKRLASALGYKNLEEIQGVTAEIRSYEGCTSGDSKQVDALIKALDKSLKALNNDKLAGMTKDEIKEYVKKRVRKAVDEATGKMQQDMVTLVAKSVEEKSKVIAGLEEEVLELQRAMAVVTPALRALLKMSEAENSTMLNANIQSAMADTRTFDCVGTFWYPQEMDGIYGKIAKEFRLDPQSVPRKNTYGSDPEPDPSKSTTDGKKSD